MNLIVSVRQQSLLALLKGYPGRLVKSLEKAMNRATIALQARVKQKLSGEVLHVRSGTLRRSINRTVELRGNAIVGEVGTNVEYAAAHEYGFHGAVTVRAHVRRVASRNVAELRGKKPKVQATGVAFVSAHTMMMNLPERSFLRSALRELEPAIERELSQAALEALQT